MIASAESDFVAGNGAGLAVAIAALRWFPRGNDALLTDAQRETAKLAGTEA